MLRRACPGRRTRRASAPAPRRPPHTRAPFSASVTTSSVALISFFMPARSLLLPVPGPLDRLLPVCPAGRALLVAPPGLPRPVDLPVAAQLVQAAPEADGEAGGVRGAERGRLADRRPHHRRAQDVGLELHQE